MTILRKQVKVGQKLGIISADGTPLAVPRTFDLAAVHDALAKGVANQNAKVGFAKEQGVLRPTGAAFEDLFMTLGMAEGYSRAVNDVLHTLYGMNTHPPV